MKAVYKKIFFTFLMSFVIGSGAISLVASSDNGYVAGFVFLPLFFLIAIISLFSFIIGLILLGSKEKSAPWVLLSAVLIPACFISSGLVAKYFEIGAYREEPMVSFTDEVSNIILFREGTTNDQIEDFWKKTIAIEQLDERDYSRRTGVGTITRIQSRNGRESIAFGFSPSATEEQKQIVFAKVKSSPIVYQVLENQSIKEWNASSENSSPSSNSNAPLKKGVTTGSATSK